MRAEGATTPDVGLSLLALPPSSPSQYPQSWRHYFSRLWRSRRPQVPSNKNLAKNKELTQGYYYLEEGSSPFAPWRAVKKVWKNSKPLTHISGSKVNVKLNKCEWIEYHSWTKSMVIMDLKVSGKNHSKTTDHCLLFLFRWLSGNQWEGNISQCWERNIKRIAVPSVVCRGRSLEVSPRF